MSGDSVGAGREPERVVATLRPHGRALFWPSVALIVTGGATGWFSGRFDEQWENVTVLVAGAVVALLLWMLPLMRWLSKRYVITTRRVVLRKGVLLRSRQELPHAESYGIVVRKNALQSLMRSGDIEIDTGPGRPAVLRDVPAADLVQRTLHDLRETIMNPNAPVLQSHPGSQGQLGQRGFPPSGGDLTDRGSVPYQPAASQSGDQDETRRWGTR